MFRKRPPGGKDSLADRTRQLSNRDTGAPGAPRMAKNVTQRAPRQPVFKDATLILPDGARVKAVIKDLTATGARVEYFHQTQLPGAVVIAAALLRLRCNARVVWQTGSAAGLQFLDDA